PKRNAIRARLRCEWSEQAQQRRFRLAASSRNFEAPIEETGLQPVGVDTDFSPASRSEKRAFHGHDACIEATRSESALRPAAHGGHRHEFVALGLEGAARQRTSEVTCPRASQSSELCTASETCSVRCRR